jgi:cytochrome c-type biogenesis protein
MAEISMVIAFLAGIGSFFAPCILPMVPAFLAYISGTTLSEIKTNDNVISINKANVFFNSIFFVLGFSVVFSALGVAINSIFYENANQIISEFNQIGGIIIICFGAYMILSHKIRILNVEKKIFPKSTGAKFPVSFLFGMAFAAGWTPCVGPILGTVITLAATTPGIAFNLLLAYSVGMGIPFILMGALISKSSKIVSRMRKHLKYYTVIFGVVIIILGVLVFFNQLVLIANFPLLNDLILRN